VKLSSRVYEPHIGDFWVNQGQNDAENKYHAAQISSKILTVPVQPAFEGDTAIIWGLCFFHAAKAQKGKEE
jgi:hypothetical protein